MTAPQRLPKMKRMQSLPLIARRLLLGALLTLGAASALPQGLGLYTVEIVVFRNGGDSAALADTATAAITGDDVEFTPAATARLNSAAAKLRAKTSGMRVLAHMAWTQRPTTWDSGHGISAKQLGLGEGIEGKISLERSNTYPLNLRLDLTVADGGRRYRITQIRRNVKVNQIQYADHPSIGVLAIVSPATGG